MKSADAPYPQNRRNFYRILHVQPDAPAEVIRMSYRTLMQRLKMHPDLGGDHRQAALINEAFATLRDPQARAAYDRILASSADVRATARSSRASPRRGPAADAAKASSAARPAPGAAGATSVCAFCGESYSAHDATKPTGLCWRCESPLFPASRQPREASEGRGLDRMPRNIAVNIRLSGPEPHAFGVTTEDISISGARFTSAVELAAGQIIKLDAAFCTAVGIVRHARADPESLPPWFHVGVEFLTLLIKQPRGALVSTQV